MKIGQSLSSTPIGGWPEDEMHKWGSYFVPVLKSKRKAHRCIKNLRTQTNLPYRLIMDSKEFLTIRSNLDKTQKQMAELMGVSLRSVQSFEQGWRKIPSNIERQILYLLVMKHAKETPLRLCWEVENCPPEKKRKCPAWEFHSGHLCWFINGTICQGIAHKNWGEKMEFCRSCPVFLPVKSLVTKRQEPINGCQ